MKQKVFDRNEVIFQKGDPPTDMFIVLMGEVGLYSDTKCLRVTIENNTFGEKALDSMELRDRTAVAHKVTVCLTLNKLDYEEKTYIVEDQKQQARLKYLMSHQLCKGWSEQRCRDLNSLMTNKSYGVGDVVYAMGDEPEYLHILIQGALSMTTVVNMTDVNQFPTGQC